VVQFHIQPEPIDDGEGNGCGAKKGAVFEGDCQKSHAEEGNVQALNILSQGFQIFQTTGVNVGINPAVYQCIA
jgi:hypothetical protein